MTAREPGEILLSSGGPGGEMTGSRDEDPGPERHHASRWHRRLAAISLSSAGAIHPVLTPAHFREQTLCGVFFLAALGSRAFGYRVTG